jgi:hypothetical protein
MSHTPGPWRTSSNMREGYENVWSGNYRVAKVGNHAGGCGFAEACADAALIAAAPDLLAACEACLDLVIESIVHGMPVTKEVAAARNNACAAISKARSVQPVGA